MLGLLFLSFEQFIQQVGSLVAGQVARRHSNDVSQLGFYVFPLFDLPLVKEVIRVVNYLPVKTKFFLFDLQQNAPDVSRFSVAFISCRIQCFSQCVTNQSGFVRIVVAERGNRVRLLISKGKINGCPGIICAIFMPYPRQNWRHYFKWRIHVSRSFRFVAKQSMSD